MTSSSAATAQAQVIAEFEALASYLSDALFCVYQEQEEARSYLDSLWSELIHDITAGVPMAALSAKQNYLLEAINSVDDLETQLELVTEAVRSVVEQLPEED